MTRLDLAARIFALLALTIAATIVSPSFAPAVAQQSDNAPQADIAFQPHPTAKISEAQWSVYFQQVKSTYRKSMAEFAEQRLVVFDSADTYYAFTQPAIRPILPGLHGS
jgi:hypothetical protein